MGKKGKKNQKEYLKNLKKKRLACTIVPTVKYLEVNLLIENGKNVHGEDPMQLIEY